MSADPRAAPARRVPGELGTWVFVLADMTVFAFLFGAYLVDRSGQLETFHASQQQLIPLFGIVNTVLLLTSSLAVALALRLLATAPAAARRLLWLAIGCGLAFSVLKVAEYADKLSQGLTPQSDDFLMYYFVLTGVHWFHLACGLLVLAGLVRLTRRGGELSARERTYAEGGGVFWHMVDLLWIVLFPLLYLV
ncbi:cytochrome c oxidase subunit 3 [Patulibacter brassicae]|uniref:Cytochrome aa3 subunit 3 n=1 Tax=Patulibacter brassicae TaxID=1705717 RepID=A0ABU4VPK2_9ACTN|nr:cytochrome c oxidase subunit 3 [Patulibacter brassicae]MDX8153773.1 cytochrome c oxidase subunit 3 [Patulibacter brassicae]